LTRPDDAAFYRRVSEALALGYVLYGAPAAAFNGERPSWRKPSFGHPLGASARYLDQMAVTGKMVRRPGHLR